MKKNLIRFALGIAILLTFLGHAAKLYDLPLVDRLEAIVYDTRLLLTMPRTVDTKIVILDIDEKSLAEKEQGGEGHWPWPRDRLALLLDKLFDRYHIAVVGFDIVFAERDESSGLGVLEQLARKELRDVSQFQSALKQVQPRLAYDQIFADRMRSRQVVLGFAFSRFAGAGVKKGQLPPPVLTKANFAGKDIRIASFSGYTANLPEFQEAAAGGGHFSLDPDPDGILRRVPMLAEYDGAYYEPLSLAVVRSILGRPDIVPDTSDGAWTDAYSGFEWLRVGPYSIPVDELVTTLIPYRGGQQSFNYISAVDVMNERVETADLQGKIVLVGTSAPGLLDLRATPVDRVYPGVEVHANMIAGILDRNLKQKPPYATGAEFMLLLMAGLAMALLLPLLNPFKSLLVTLAVLAAAIFTNLSLFHYANLVLPLASGLLLIALLFALNMTYGFFVETRGKRQITGLFGQYVPPELVDEMAKNPESLSMEGKSREMTVLFTDVRGFTTISERLEPRELSQFMNAFLTPLTEVIYSHRGTVDKFMGDCIMAFWGAPLPDTDHARNGVLTGLQMHAALKKLKTEFVARGWPEIKIGVGLNTGRMSVGNMGSKRRTAYTVMGDAVNLASRLEGITKEYGADIIVGENTKTSVPDAVFRELDRVRVKGKDEAVAIFEAIGLEGQIEEVRLEEVGVYDEFLRLYRAQAWAQAEERLQNLQKLVPGNVLYSATFVERIAYLRENPPGDDWDGAFTFKTK